MGCEMGCSSTLMLPCISCTTRKGGSGGGCHLLHAKSQLHHAVLVTFSEVYFSLVLA